MGRIECLEEKRGTLLDAVSSDCKFVVEQKLLLATYVRQKVKQCIACQCADRQADQHLDDVAMMIFDHWYDEDTAEADDAYEHDRGGSVEPELQHCCWSVDVEAERR